MGATLTGTPTERAMAGAARLHTNLCAGVWPQPTSPGFDLEPGEVAHANFFDSSPRDLAFSRHVTPESVFYHRPVQVAWGSPQFVAGFAMASVVTSAVGHHRARRMSRPYWQEPASAWATLTDRRLFCAVFGEEVYFDYSATSAVQPDLRGWAVTLRFFNAEPLRLTGYKAPYIATYIAHRVYGHVGAAQMPELAGLL